jgi:hypothetical protein
MFEQDDESKKDRLTNLEFYVGHDAARSGCALQRGTVRLAALEPERAVQRQLSWCKDTDLVVWSK